MGTALLTEAISFDVNAAVDVSDAGLTLDFWHDDRSKAIIQQVMVVFINTDFISKWIKV